MIGLCFNQFIISQMPNQLEKTGVICHEWCYNHKLLQSRHPRDFCLPTWSNNMWWSSSQGENLMLWKIPCGQRENGQFERCISRWCPMFCLFQRKGPGPGFYTLYLYKFNILLDGEVWYFTNHNFHGTPTKTQCFMMFPLRNDQIWFVFTTTDEFKKICFKHLLCERGNDVPSHAKIGEPQKKLVLSIVLVV